MTRNLRHEIMKHDFVCSRPFFSKDINGEQAPLEQLKSCSEWCAAPTADTSERQKACHVSKQSMFHRQKKGGHVICFKRYFST